MIIGEEEIRQRRKKSLSRREKKIVAPLFSGGLSPAEAALGESPVSGRRTGLTHDLRNGPFALWEKGE